MLLDRFKLHIDSAFGFPLYRCIYSHPVWWLSFNPSEKISQSKWGSSSPSLGVKITKYLKFHHLVMVNWGGGKPLLCDALALKCPCPVSKT